MFGKGWKRLWRVCRWNKEYSIDVTTFYYAMLIVTIEYTIRLSYLSQQFQCRVQSMFTPPILKVKSIGRSNEQ